MNNLNDYVLVGNYLPADLCDKVIKKIDEDSWQTHEWYDVKAHYDKKKETYTSHEDKELLVQRCDKRMHNLLGPKINKAIGDYHKKHAKPGKYRLYSRMSSIRLNKYPEGTVMRDHIDHIHDIFDGSVKGVPVLSMVGVLNDDFEGGDFIMCGNKLSLKKGDVLLFPSNFLFPHEVTEITKGTRYSCVNWAY